MPGLWLGYLHERVHVGAGYLYIWANGPLARDEHVVDVWTWAPIGDWGAGVELAAPFSSSTAALQVTPSFGWGPPGGVVAVALRPSLTWWARADDDALLGALHVSGELALTLRPLAWLEIALSGWYGRRRSFVEGGGRWLWNTDDLFQGGGRLGLRFRATDALAILLQVRDDAGIERSGEEEEFHLITAQVGVALVL